MKSNVLLLMLTYRFGEARACIIKNRSDQLGSVLSTVELFAMNGEHLKQNCPMNHWSSVSSVN